MIAINARPAATPDPGQRQVRSVRAGLGVEPLLSETVIQARMQIGHFLTEIVYRARHS